MEKTIYTKKDEMKIKKQRRYNNGNIRKLDERPTYVETKKKTFTNNISQAK